MDYISIDQKPHLFEKVNLTSLKDQNGVYDIYECKHCGLRGKRYGLSNKLLVDITLKKVKLCDGRNTNTTKEEKDTISLGKVIIKIPPCVIGAENINAGDIVDILRRSNRGVWIKGVEVTPELKKLDPDYNGEILLLFHEFEEIKDNV